MKPMKKFATVKRMLKRGKSSLAKIEKNTDLPLTTVQEIADQTDTIVAGYAYKVLDGYIEITDLNNLGRLYNQLEQKNKIK